MGNRFNESRGISTNPFRKSDLGSANQEKPHIFDYFKNKAKTESSGIELRYRGSNEAYLKVLEYKKDEDLKRSLELIKHQEDYDKRAMINLENMMRVVVKNIETAVEGKPKETYEEQLGILERKKQKILEERSSRQYLQKLMVARMIEGVLYLRGHAATESMSENPERVFYGNPKILERSVNNTLELDRISEEIRHWELQPDIIVEHAIGRAGSASRRRPNNEKNSHLRRLASEKERIQLAEAENLRSLTGGSEQQRREVGEVSQQSAEGSSSTSSYQ